MTTILNNIPQGYKATALGVIPQEWEVKCIKDFGPVITGSTPPTFDSENYGGSYMFVSPADLSEDKKYITTTEKTLTDKGFSQARKIPKGSVLFTCIGSTIGKVGIASQDLATNQQINAVITDGEYLFYVLSLHSDRIRILANEQAVPIINKSDFERIKLAVPPLGEQRKIAEVLGVWDLAIAKQVQLVERLTQRKRALMQRLLTAKLRLPGFSAPWKKVKLGEICERVTRKNIEDNQNVMTISAQRGFVAQTDFFNKSVASETLESYYLVFRDEFCYNKSYSNGYPMGAIKRLSEANKAVVTSLYICFNVKPETDTNIDYLSYYFDNGGLNRGLTKIANEGGRAHGLLNVTPKDFFGLSFEIPSLKEQTAIAEVLTAADREIELAQAKLELYRRQKRGLMQQLLTGKKRVTY